MTAASTRCFEAAVEYALRGLPVFPVRPDKKPYTGHGFKDAMTDTAAIAAAWTRWPEAGVGMPTGAASGLIVIDIDPRHGGDVTLDECQKRFGPLPHTVESLTGGGGRHLFFRYPGKPIPCSAGRLGSGLDVRADGGYVVLPPSHHESGRTYEWEGSSTLGDLEVAELPAAWLKAIEEEVPKAEPSRGTEGVIPEGQRNNVLTSLAGTMRRRGMTPEAIEAALGVENRDRCDPPLSEAEVRTIARSVGRYTPADPVTSSTQPTTSADTQAPPRPFINVDTARLDLAADAAIVALREAACAAEDRIYSRGGVLVRIRRDRAKDAKFKDGSDAPTIAIVDANHLAHYRLPLVADFVNADPKKTVLFSDLAKSVLSVDAEGFSRITGIVTAPALRPDGTILSTPGYDEATGLFYAPEPVFEGFCVPDQPTAKDVKDAVEALLEVYGDFAFASIDDRAAAMSFVFTLFARDAVRGNTPIHAVTAPAAGSGKSWALDVGANIYFGYNAPRWDAPSNEDEEKKSILALALSGQRCVLADNHPESRPFGSSEISKAVTSDTYQGRVLGHTREVVLPMRIVWAVTGNNLTFKDTVGRRVVLSRIDTDLEDPTTREYARPDLLDYVRSRRPALARAVLLLLRAHAAAGIEVLKGSRKVKLSFVEWDKWVRGALLRAGLGDPDGAGDEITTDLDLDRQILSAVLQALGAAPFTMSELLKRAEDGTPLRQAIEAALFGRKIDANSVGVMLRSLKDRPSGGLVLRGRRGHRGLSWHVVQHAQAATPRAGTNYDEEFK
jgi:hypothetical protein